MKTFEQYNNIDEKEELFLELAHLDELELKFDFIKYKDYLFFFYDNNWLFNQDKKSKFFWINYNKIWSFFEKKFSINYKEIQDFMKVMLEKYFKSNGYSTRRSHNACNNLLEKYFKSNGYSTMIHSNTGEAVIDKSFRNL